jgi:hypothetical protein
MAWAQAQFPASCAIAQAFIKAQEQLSGRSIARVTALYRPDVDGPAYLEFLLRKDSEDAGFVIVSTGGHDAPIYAWAENGSGATRSLEKMHKRDLASAHVFVTGPGQLVAEVSDGSVLSSTSPSFNRNSWTATKTNLVRSQLARNAELKAHVDQAWDRATKAAEVALPSDMQPLCPTDGCGGDPCKYGEPIWPMCLSPGGGHWRVLGGEPPPNYVQFWGNWWDSSCYSGCVPTSLSIIAGWISHQAGNHATGSPWGHPRMAYAYDNGGADTWGPQTTGSSAANGDDDPTEWRPVKDIRDRLETLCVGDGGATRLTPPYDRVKSITQTYFNDLGAPVNVASLYHAGWESYYGAIVNEVKNGRPVVITGLDSPTGGSEAHTWVIWGYNNNAFGETFGMNLTWGGWAPVWWGIGSALQTITPTSYVGEGIVMFRPGTSRDHGPITTGAGSGWCLDVAGPSTANGAIVQQYGCHGGDNQLWYLDRNYTDGAWRIRNRYSGKCLAPWDGGSYNGAQMVQWTCDANDPNERWAISKRGNKVMLSHLASHRFLDLDNSGGMPGYNKKIQVWDYNAGANQLFDFAY